LGSALQIVSDRDKATRAAALGTLELVYMSEGQAIWSMLGRLSDQQHSLLEERFKYTDKQVLLAPRSAVIANCPQNHALQICVRPDLHWAAYNHRVVVGSNYSKSLTGMES